MANFEQSISNGQEEPIILSTAINAGRSSTRPMLSSQDPQGMAIFPMINLGRVVGSGFESFPGLNSSIWPTEERIQNADQVGTLTTEDPYVDTPLGPWGRVDIENVTNVHPADFLALSKLKSTLSIFFIMLDVLTN